MPDLNLILRNGKPVGVAMASGGSGSLEQRFDSVSLTNYTGRASAGTLESAEEWTIRRTIFATDGSVASTATATGVAWDDRLTATYT